MLLVFLQVLGASLLALLLLGGIVTITWFIETSLYQPMTNYDGYRHVMVKYSIREFWSAFLTLFTALPFLLFGALFEIGASIVNNLLRLFFLFLFVTAAFGWLTYHDDVVQTYLIARQCVLVPLGFYFIFPLWNTLRIIFNCVIVLWNYYVDINKFLTSGAQRIFLKCTLNTVEPLNFFTYFANIFLVFVEDLQAWFVGGIFDTDFNITLTLEAIGLFIDSFVPPLKCFCKALGFLFDALSIFFRLPSLVSTLNCILNFFITLAQIPFNMVRNGLARPVFEQPTLRACCALSSFGTLVEDTLFLILQTGWGLFTGSTTLPIEVALVASCPWAHTLTDPVCGIVRLVNVSLTAAANYDQLLQASGIGFLQFGFIFDEFRMAADSLACLMVLFNNDAQATLAQALISIINAVAFLFEWIPGNIWYFLYGGPLPLYPSAPFGTYVNFLQYYFPNYWLLPFFDNTINNSTYVYATALDATFTSLVMFTQALGNLIGGLLDMDPVGGLIQHALNIIIMLLRIVINLTHFIFTIVTFDTDPRTTARQVDTTSLFNEMYFFAGSAGDFFRQFDEPDPLSNLTCVPSLLGDDEGIFCCLGRLVERGLDVIIIALQQATYFLQDILTLPTGNVIICLVFIPFNTSNGQNCLRIPDLTTALFLLDEALCAFTCAFFSIIPSIIIFQCRFPLPPPPTSPNVPPENPKPCGSIPTCFGVVACRWLRFFLVPAYIVNLLMAKTLGGQSYQDFTNLGNFMLQILFSVIADAVAGLGLLLNCTLCAFTAGGRNCDDAIYQLFLAFANLLRFVPMLLTKTLGLIIKLVLVTLIGLFSGDPVGALVKFIVGVLTDLFNGLGKAVVDLLVKLFDAIGLGFVGTFVKLIWQGLCPLLELVLNAIIALLQIITFGLVEIKFVNFCCSGDPNCTPGQGKRSEEGLVDGVLNINVDSLTHYITQYVQWAPNNPCNATMSQYAGYNFTDLTEWQQNEVLFCLIKPLWSVRTDNQSIMMNSTCDVLIAEYNFTDWSRIDILTRRTIIDCIYSRLFVDGFRNSANLQWIPSDILTNPYRKYIFAAEYGRGLMIYWQYFKDQSVSTETFRSANYQNYWASLGLNISCYQGVVSTDDILIFRDRYRLIDYFAWNKASQYQAVRDTSVGFWSFLYTLVDSFSNITQAMSDDEMDPTIYMTYDYSLDNSAAGITSSIYGLFGEFVAGAKNISAYWSNPENVKKRESAAALVREGSHGIYRAAVNEMTRIAVDYILEKRNESRYWSGNCSVEEGQQFVEEYNYSLHHDNRSTVYRLARWYENNKHTLFKTYRISNPRDGDRRVTYNQTRTLFEYKDPYTGEMKEETGRERLSRLVSATFSGSAESVHRWSLLSNIYSTAKERLFKAIIRNNQDFADTYVNDLRRSIKPENIVVNENTILVQTDDEKKEYAVDRQRKEQQELYCHIDKYKEDGLCQNFVPTVRPKEPSRFLAAKDVKKHADGVIISPNSSWHHVAESQFVDKSAILINAFIDLPCFTNVSFYNTTLCEECFYLDQLLGRVETGLDWVFSFYFNGQFNASIQVALDFYEYAFDDNAFVIVGDSPQLPPNRFPGRDGTWWYNTRYFGDNVPNKTRFNDVIALFETNRNGTNSTVPQDELLTDTSNLNGWVGYFVLLLFGWFWQLIVDIFSFFIIPEGNLANGTAFATAEFFLDWFYTCDWLVGNDVLGTVYRFSIGETILIFVAVYVVFSAIFLATIQFNVLNLLIFTAVGMVVTLSLFLSIAQNFGYACYPALPAVLADAVLYFIFYSLLPKCMWFWAFLIKNAEYTNLTCFFCDTASQWEILNCATDIGFVDIFSNIIFMLQFYLPSSLEFIRTTPILPISLIYQIPFVNQRINAYANLDMSNPQTYAQYMGCNYIVTLLSNFYIAILLAYLLSIIFPLISVLLIFLFDLLFLFYRFLRMINAMAMDLFVTRTTAPFTQLGIMDMVVPETIEEDEDESEQEQEQQTPMNSAYRKPRKTRYSKKTSFTLATLHNMLQRGWNNLFLTERKRK